MQMYPDIKNIGMLTYIGDKTSAASLGLDPVCIVCCVGPMRILSKVNRQLRHDMLKGGGFGLWVKVRLHIVHL